MSINNNILSGRFVADPEVVQLPKGSSVANFVLAVNDVFSTKEGGRQEHTSFIEVKAYGNQAENIGKYFAKGRMILIEGKLRQEKWEDKEGNKRSKIVVKMERFHFIDSKKTEQKDEEAVKPELEEAIPF